MIEGESDISVVICCYNSSKRILSTLEYLAAQNFKGSWEVILIDNNSSDDTAVLAQSFWNSLTPHVSLKVVCEKRPGLSYARECGINHAVADLIIFCDDDNWLDSHYLQRAFDIMQSDSSIGALGGMSTAAFEDTPPSWFEKVKASYAIGKQSEQSGYVPDSRGYLWGAGLVFRKSIFQQILKKGYKPLLSDRQGGAVSSGGDGEFCAVLRLSGYKLYYSSDLKFQHFMTKARLSWPYYLKLLNSFGRARAYLGLYDYVILKKMGQITISSREYWNDKFFFELKSVGLSTPQLLRLWLNNKEGDLSVIVPRMKFAMVLEMFRIGRKHTSYIGQIVDTFGIH